MHQGKNTGDGPDEFGPRALLVGDVTKTKRDERKGDKSPSPKRPCQQQAPSQGIEDAERETKFWIGQRKPQIAQQQTTTSALIGIASSVFASVWLVRYETSQRVAMPEANRGAFLEPIREV